MKHLISRYYLPRFSFCFRLHAARGDSSAETKQKSHNISWSDILDKSHFQLPITPPPPHSWRTLLLITTNNFLSKFYVSTKCTRNQRKRDFITNNFLLTLSQALLILEGLDFKLVFVPYKIKNLF